MSTLKQTQTPSRYDDLFARLKQEKRHALIPFTLLGWPTPQRCLETIDAFVAGGASALELGLAFSDPVADGPLIQQAGRAVLEAGFDVDQALDLLKQIRQNYPHIPISLLVYYNLVLVRGIDRFCQDTAEAGADGLLIADLPVEGIAEIKPALDQYGLQLTSIISTRTTADRLPKIAAQSGGFLYAVSRLGITGVEERYDQSLGHLLTQARQCSNLPVCVGFGISKREHVESMIALGADGVIVGSAVMAKIQELDPNGSVDSIREYIAELEPIR